MNRYQYLFAVLFCCSLSAFLSSTASHSECCFEAGQNPDSLSEELSAGMIDFNNIKIRD